MTNSSIGERLKERRKKFGLTQSQLAKKVHVSASHISYFECGKRIPSSRALNLLSEVLECSTDWLLKGSNSQAPTNASFKNSTTYTVAAETSATELPDEETPCTESPTIENINLLNIKKILEMYLYIDTADQEEIKLLLELKYKKKEKEWNEFLADLLNNHTNSSTL